MLRRLYSWVLDLAAGPHAVTALIVVAFAESSVFPLPPDILLIPMMLARRHRAWTFAALATAASVAGGTLGYAIGYFLFDAIGRPLLEFYHAMGSYEALRAAFAKWGVWIILIKGMTPIPYKLVTIASGVVRFNFLAFVLASIVSRSLRFFLIAAVLRRYGASARDFIERRLALVTTAFAIALVGGFAALHYL